MLNKFSRTREHFSIERPFSGSWIEAITAKVNANFKSTICVSRDSIIKIISVEIHPHRHGIKGIRLGPGYTKVVCLLLRAGDFVLEIRKKLTKPGTTSEEINICNDFVSIGQIHVVNLIGGN